MWTILIERVGQDPEVFRTFRKLEVACETAAKMAVAYRRYGENRPKVLIMSADSADQLQTYRHGTRAVRDQPHLPAFGQDVVILAPTATAAARTLPIGGE